MTTSTLAQPPQLPTPEQRPLSDVLIYDGQCRMCSAQMRTLRRLDTGGRLAFVSLHDPLVERRWPDLSHDELMRQMVLIDQQGGRHWGASAVRYLSRRLPTLWPLAPLLHIPLSMPLWRALYGLVARNRYRFGKVEACDSGSCRIHW